MGSTMSRYVALLRGVNNIGTSRRVAMADLPSLFENLGFRDVRTLLNSGNVIFTASRKDVDNIPQHIEKGLTAGLGLTVPVIVFSGKEVATAVRNNPLSTVAANPSHLLVMTPQT
jgi:uncharacterized protein (DUF1697 family)